MRVHRRAAAPIVVLLAASLAACAPALPPPSVVVGSEIVVGWGGEFTSANVTASPTGGNADIAQTTRSDFGDVVDGVFVPDTGFGAVEIIGEDPFTVRYDLAEPAWSDGIPVDAADLLLGWAGASGILGKEAGEDKEAGEADDVADVPRVDEFERTIEVTFPQPEMDWQTALPVSVPAHVVGRKAFGLDDEMEAKQAVIRAIQDGDADALASIAKVWNEGFDLPEKGRPDPDMLLSSGPYMVDRVKRTDEGQRVTLVPNPAYRGAAKPSVARIDLVPPGEQPLSALGESLDIVQVAPVTANRAQIRALERKDHPVEATDDGTAWTVLLNPSGVFTGKDARTAFLRSVPASAMVERGAGEWASAYTASTSVVTAPGTPAYDIVNEDSGFAAALGTPDDDPVMARKAAGVADDERICVLYDRRSEFASGAFLALREALREEGGWNVTDCGSDDIAGAFGKNRWNAVIQRMPIPQTAEQVAAQWGTGAGSSVARTADAGRDELIGELSRTTDVYESREMLAYIEASIVATAVARPIAVNPRVTILDRGVGGVKARGGAVAPLTYGVGRWTAAP